MERLSRPLPVWYLTGTADPADPLPRRPDRPAANSLRPAAHLPAGAGDGRPVARLNGCPLEPQVVSEDAVVRVERYGPVTTARRCSSPRVTGNGHHWPGTVEPLRAR
ncbi:MAG: hypothetical protein WDO13_02630 [Verrucomicrobiota bacterium]